MLIEIVEDLKKNMDNFQGYYHLNTDQKLSTYYQNLHTQTHTEDTE